MFDEAISIIQSKNIAFLCLKEQCTNAQVSLNIYLNNSFKKGKLDFNLKGCETKMVTEFSTKLEKLDEHIESVLPHEIKAIREFYFYKQGLMEENKNASETRMEKSCL